MTKKTHARVGKGIGKKRGRPLYSSVPRRVTGPKTGRQKEGRTSYGGRWTDAMSFLSSPRLSRRKTCHGGPRRDKADRRKKTVIVPCQHKNGNSQDIQGGNNDWGKRQMIGGAWENS